MLKVKATRQNHKPAVQYDAAGHPLPQNLSRHLRAAELDDAAFDAWLAAEYRRQDRTGLTEMFQSLEAQAVA